MMTELRKVDVPKWKAGRKVEELLDFSPWLKFNVWKEPTEKIVSLFIKASEEMEAIEKARHLNSLVEIELFRRKKFFTRLFLSILKKDPCLFKANDKKDILISYVCRIKSLVEWLEQKDKMFCVSPLGPVIWKAKKVALFIEKSKSN